MFRNPNPVDIFHTGDSSSLDISIGKLDISDFQFAPCMSGRFFEKVVRASPMSLLLISCQEESFFQLISQQIRFSSEKETRRHQFEIITGAPARR
jgi:hypothetical protein